MTEQPYRIASYLRLSKEDRDREAAESGSIGMQRQLLQEYVRAHFKQYTLTEFCDDGYTGTNFRRPGVTALLAQVKAGAIDCIIVKDFSRFSRDYIELGTYVGQLFPLLNVRFISVNDGYDSADGNDRAGDLDVIFRHLLCDLYSKDLSVKVRSALAVRQAKGIYTASAPPFGYEKAAKDRHMLKIAEDEAAVVRKIFGMAADGMSSSRIAKCLNEEGVKTPAEFRAARGKAVRQPKGDGFWWESSTVCAILRNEVYTGAIVCGKYSKDFAGGKCHLRPREEWKVFDGHHEAIIENSLFEAAQKRRGVRFGRKGKSHPLVGKLICGCCGRNLTYRKRRNPYFYCQNRYVNGREECVRRLNVMYAEEALLFSLRQEFPGGHEGTGGFTEDTAELLLRAVVTKEMQIEPVWDLKRGHHPDTNELLTRQ